MIVSERIQGSILGNQIKEVLMHVRGGKKDLHRADLRLVLDDFLSSKDRY